MYVYAICVVACRWILLPPDTGSEGPTEARRAHVSAATYQTYRHIEIESICTAYGSPLTRLEVDVRAEPPLGVREADIKVLKQRMACRRISKHNSSQL